RPSSSAWPSVPTWCMPSSVLADRGSRSRLPPRVSPTQAPISTPGPLSMPFAPDLLRAAAFAHRMDQLDAVGVDDPEHRRGGHTDLRPVLMRLQEAKEPGALGELRKQRAVVARQPPIERPVAPAFQGMEQPQGDHLTGPEASLGM